MSVYIQEVLGLLKRNKRKKKLDKVKDHFEFGKLYQTSNLNTGAAYNPKMEPFVVRWGDLVCEATEDLTRTQPGSGNLGFVPVYTTPEGSCSWDTLKDSIITQNAIGDTINIAGNLYVEGTITTPTLTEDRIVIVGPGGVLEDDANFTMDGVTFTALVNVQHGVPVVSPTQPTTNTVINSNIFLNGPVYDSQGNVGGLAQVLVGLADGRVIWSDDDVVEALTYGSLWQGNINNLKQELPIGTADQILISDGVTFSWEDNPAAIVGEQCAVYTIPLWTPNSNTLGCSKLVQDGDNSTPATNIISSVTFNVQNTLTDSIINLINDDNNQVNFFTPGNNVYGIEAEANGSSTAVKIEHFTSEDANLTKEEFISLDLDTTQTNNKLVLGGDAAGGVHPRLADGSVQINVDLELEDVINDDTLDQVLVRDPANDNLVKWRSALTISPQLGWDIVSPDTGIADWDVVKYNGFMLCSNVTAPTRAIRPNNLTDGEEGYFVFVVEQSDLPLDFLQFTGVNGSNALRVRTTWSGTGNNVYTPTAQAGGFWQYGTAVKFHYIVRQDPGANTFVIWWDACCEIQAQNDCPVGTATSFTVDEDTTTPTLSLPATDDGIGTLVWSIVQQPLDADGVTSAGTINLDPTTGQYTFTPALNYYGSGTFTWEVSDGYCSSDVITVNFTVTAVAESPVFQVYEGVGNPCGAPSIPTVYQGLVGGSYLYEGHYCDPDHNYTDVTLVSEYSTTGTGGPWISGLPANFALTKDDLSGTPTPWRFTFTSSSVPSGQTCFRLTLTDPDGNSNQQVFCVSAAFDILQNMQFQMDYEDTTLAPAGNSRIPVQSNDNLGEWSAAQNVQTINSTGFTLNNRTSFPTGNFGTSSSVSGIIPTGGTYPGVTNGATFNLYIKNGNPYEMSAQVDSIPSDNNISVGDTIIFNQTLLDNTFPNTAPHNAPLTYTIVEEDIKFAPNNGGTAIPLVQSGAMDTGHGCNDGGFALVFSVVNSSGQTEIFKSRRFDCSNQGINTNKELSLNKFTNANFSFAPNYLNVLDGTQFNRPWWDRQRQGGGWATYFSDIDTSDAGIICEKRNYQGTALPGYYVNGFNYLVDSRTSGIFKLTDSLITQLAATSGDGIVTAKLIGDTWQRASGSGATARVTNIDANGAITGVVLVTGGSGYAWYSPSEGRTACQNGSGTGAFLSCTANNGVITGVTVWTDRAGSGYQINDILTLDGDGTAYARTHGDAVGIRIFREDPSNPGSHIEIGIDPTTGRSIVAGDGTSVQIDLFNNTVTVV
jgi:hypothetical protein